MYGPHAARGPVSLDQPRLKKLRKQRSAYLGPTRYVYGGRNKTRVRQSHRTAPKSLGLSVVATREGSSPSARVSWLWALQCRPVARGLKSSQGCRRSPLPLISWRRYSGRSGGCHSEKAVCYGWGVTLLGCPPLRRVGPRHPASPLGLARGGEP